METLSVTDASFLHLEGDGVQMHIGGVSIFAGPAPRLDDVAAMVRGKLPRVPRYRQKVRFAPLGVGRPVWVDDPHFTLDYHLRHTALPGPGGEAELRRLTGRIMSQQLDRAKPLWEMWMVEGLDGDRWALVNKIHHCMVDGVAATDLLSVMLDSDPDAVPAPDDRWTAGGEPGDAELLVGSLAGTLHPREVLAELTEAARRPRRTVEQARSALASLISARGFLRPVGSSLTGPVGPHRRWSWAQADLAEVKRIRKNLGGTVNDVVLAAIARGFRDLITARGESVTGRKVRTMVPVSVRTGDQHGEYNNRVSAVFADLPVGIDDPQAALLDIHGQMADLKSSEKAVAGEVLTSLGGFAPSMLLALGMRAVARAPQLTFETVTTNVPGPQNPLYAAGRRMLASYPYVPIAGPVRIVVAIFSYDGTLTFGVTGDYDTGADIDVLCAGIEAGVAEMLAATAVAA